VSDPLIDNEDDAATPLTPEEREGLIATHGEDRQGAAP
jgi:hypothetical protein